jgi:hypothetical protein
MLVNDMAFLTMLSQKLLLATVEQLPMRTSKQLNGSLTKIVRLYVRTGFIVRVMRMDQEFDKRLKTKLTWWKSTPLSPVNTLAKFNAIPARSRNKAEPSCQTSLLRYSLARLSSI